MKNFIMCCFFVLVIRTIPQECFGDKGNEVEMGDLSGFGKKQIGKCFKKLIAMDRTQDISVLSERLSDGQDKLLAQLLSEEIKKLQYFEEEIILEKSTCEPIIKWAQNMTHVFISAKLSHRWDSPPCVKTVSEDYRLNNSTITFINVCLVSNVELKFTFCEILHRQTVGDVSVKKDGVGTFSIIFAKETAQVWTYLFERAEVIPMWEEIMDDNSAVKNEYSQKLKEIDAAKIAAKAKNEGELQLYLLFVASLILIAL